MKINNITSEREGSA